MFKNCIFHNLLIPCCLHWCETAVPESMEPEAWLGTLLGKLQAWRLRGYRGRSFRPERRKNPTSGLVVWWKCKDSTFPIVSPDIVDNEESISKKMLQVCMFDISECPRFRSWTGLCMYVLGDVQPCPSGFEFTVQIQPTVGIDEYFFSRQM